MRMFEVRLTIPESELLDAAEDVERLLEHEVDDDLSPSFRDVLLALDDAVTEVLAGGERAARSAVAC